ncbi:hypothetical protein MCEMIEM13_01258 [Comamonadaceae bacterium]
MKLPVARVRRWCSAGATSLAFAWGLAGCADVEHIGWQLASSTKPALMQVAAQRLEGDVQIRPDRTGAIRMAGNGNLASCAGSLRFTAVNSGAMDMRCSDGAMFDLRFVMVNEVKGYAYGTHKDAVIALTFGMDEPEAQAYLARAQPRTTEPMPEQMPTKP